jgi:uncharacterized protein YjbI with pentapeptide repeats
MAFEHVRHGSNIRLLSYSLEDMAAVVGRLQLFDTDLWGAFLVGANLQAALLGGVHLQEPHCATPTCGVRFSSMRSSAT